MLVAPPPQPDEPDTAVTAHKRILVIAILVIAAAGVTMGQMGWLLSGFHQPGEPTVDHAAIQGPTDPLHVGRRIDQALLTWSRYARPDLHFEADADTVELPKGQTFEKDRNAPITVLTWFFGFDAGFFVSGYLAILGLCLVLATRKLTVRAGALEKSARISTESFISVARIATVCLIVAAFADQIENWTGLTWATSAWFAGVLDPSDMTVDGWVVLLGVATVVKTAAFGLTVLFLLLIGGYLLRNSADSHKAWSGVRSSWQSLLAVRVQILAVALFAGLLGLPFQVADTFRRWTDDGWVVFFAFVLVLALAVGIWHSGSWLVKLAWEPSRVPSPRLVCALSGATVVALMVFAEVGGGLDLVGFAVPAGIALLLTFLSWCARNVPAVSPIVPSRTAGGLPRALAVILFAFFGLVVLKASTGEFVYSWMQGAPLVGIGSLLALGLAYLFGSLLLLLVLPRVRWARPRPPGAQRRRHSAWAPSLVLLICIVAWLLVVVLLDHQVFAISSKIGTAGVLAGFLILFTYTLSSAIAVTSSGFRNPPHIFRAAGLRRTPVLSLLAAWALAASLLPLNFRHHVMIPATRGEVAVGETLESAFVDWSGDNCLESGAAPGERDVVPLVLVSSSGGGVKAAVWTSFVMDRLFGFDGDGLACGDRAGGDEGNPRRDRAIFAMSGISGGGLGFVEYSAQLGQEPPSDDAETRIRAHLGDDSLAATLAWMLYVEGPWSLLRFDTTRDRGDILQESWLRQWDGSGLAENFLDVRSEGHQTMAEEGDRLDDIPLILLNGASAESGCRFNGSMLDANGRDRDDAVIGCLEPRGLEGSPDAVLPATIDLVDFVCDGQYVSMAEAALFTARFPGILPVGEIEQCASSDPDVEDEVQRLDPDPETFVVDGGYLEGSGTATILDLWHALAPFITTHNLDQNRSTCIVPFFVQIDNSYLEPAGPGDTKAPPNLLGLQELSAIGRQKDGYTTVSRQGTQIAFGQAFTLGNVRILNPDGGELVDRYVRFSPLAHPGPEAPLGWTMSSASFRDLFDQFDRNTRSLTEFESWFDGLTCTVAG